MSEVKASVVIPAYNEEKYLGRTLNSLVNQQTDINFEVIVVDNNSTDKTSKVAQSFQDKLNLRVILEKKVGRGAARARGFEEAKGEIILSTDSDTLVFPTWVETLASGIKDNIIATSTSCKITDCSPITNSLFNFIQPVTMMLYRLFLGHFWLSGFSFAILKSSYIKAGGFDTKIQAQEDLDLSFRVAKLGKIKFINKPVIFSGRRFQDGLLVGFFDYIKTFTEIFILKKRNTYLDNPR